MRRRLEGLGFLSNGLLFTAFFLRGPGYAYTRSSQIDEASNIYLINLGSTLALTIYFYYCLKQSDPKARKH